MNAVELLRIRNNDADVRAALCQTVHTDRNAAVRLKALEALDGAEPQDIIQQTLLDALVDDQNPGVRVEAINALREMAAKGQVESDGHMLAVLRDRMQKDPSTYIRLQSAACDSRSRPATKVLKWKAHCLLFRPSALRENTSVRSPLVSLLVCRQLFFC